MLCRSVLFASLALPLLGAPVLAVSDMYAPVGGTGFTAVSPDAVPRFLSVDEVSARRLRARGFVVSEVVVLRLPELSSVSPSREYHVPVIPVVEPTGPIVAVIDTGLDVSHPWFSTHVLPGRSFASAPEDWVDVDGHGTHVAGVVRQTDPSARILPVRVFDGARYGTDRMAADGIVWAVENGARVVNLSLGGGAASPALTRAVEFARSRDVVVVAAAGNYAERGSPVVYPAAFDSVIAVAALDGSSAASFSNRGAYVDIATEGMYVLSSYLGGRVVAKGGTSMASPAVAGAAARVRTARPDLSALSVKSLLESTATDLGEPGRDDVFGWGALNADLAVAAAPSLPVSAGALSLTVSPQIGGVVLRSSSPVSSVEVLADGVSVFTSNDPSGVWQIALAAPASLTVNATAPDGRRYESFIARVSPEPIPLPKLTLQRRGAGSKIDAQISLPQLAGSVRLLAEAGTTVVEFEVPRAEMGTALAHRFALDRTQSWMIRACLFYGPAEPICSKPVIVK
jgi:subtilisin family serine protease